MLKIGKSRTPVKNPSRAAANFKEPYEIETKHLAQIQTEDTLFLSTIDVKDADLLFHSLRLQN